MRDSVPTRWGCSNCCRGRQLATVSRLTCRTSCAASSTRLRAEALRGACRERLLDLLVTGDRLHCAGARVNVMDVQQASDQASVQAYERRPAPSAMNHE